MRHTIAILIAITVALGALAPGVSLASSEPSASEAAAEGPYTSPMRADCEQELRKDAEWRALLERELRSKVHEEDASQMARNKKHVVMAYAVIWILLVGFVVFMYRKQTALKDEIAALKLDLEQAAKD